MKVLIVDDQPEGFVRAQAYAKRDNDTILVVENEEQARGALSAQEFDAIFMDGHLGKGVEGPEIIRAWKKSGEMVLPPIFMISSAQEMQDRGLAAGATGAIEKTLFYSGKWQFIKQKIADCIG